MSGANRGRLWYYPTGYQMIKSISINNFRCFENLTIEGCERINVIVGDNGTGKTALLEALFLALAGNTSVAVRLRQWRGLEGMFSGTPKEIEEALWSGFFYRFDMNRRISIALSGSGPEARSLYISRSKEDILIPLSENDQSSSAISMPVEFVWKDSGGREHSYIPKVTSTGLKAPPDEEQLPDFFSLRQITTLARGKMPPDFLGSAALGDYLNL